MTSKDNKKFKILISAYACEPGRGSERGIGWGVVNQVAKYHDVCVITEALNEASITNVAYPANLQFFYYELPVGLLFLRNTSSGRRIYYYLWQIGIFFRFKNLIKTGHFDIVHHLTYGANWMPSLLMAAPVKTIWGPVGSEDVYPPIFASISFKSKCKEIWRTLIKWVFYYCDPLRWITILRANVILEHSSIHAKYKYPKIVQNKIIRCFQTGLDVSDPDYEKAEKIFREDNEKVRILVASRLVEWKGVLIAARVFSELAQTEKNLEFVIVGEGDARKDMEDFFIKRNILDQVVFTGTLSKYDLLEQMRRSDIFLYPAYHHGLATVVLQAMYCALPVVCMKGDIIGEVVDGVCGFAIGGRSQNEIVQGLVEKTRCLIKDRFQRNDLGSRGKRMVLDFFAWEKLSSQFLKIYKNILP